MAGSFKFALLRLAPKDGRHEVLNIGLAVFAHDRLEFYFSKGLEKVRSLSRALDASEIYNITESIVRLDASFLERGISALEERYTLVRDMGPIKLALDGEFVAETQLAYSARITSLLKRYVDPEIGPRRAKEKKSKVLADVKKVFRSERVLAKKHEDLSSHRIVTSVEIDEGLVADLVLKNGAVHVTETVDATDESTSLRSVISSVGISTLVLERAKMTLAESVKASLVYSASPVIEKSMRPALDAAAHFGTHLVNWQSKDDRIQFVQGLVSLAIPYEEREKQRSVPIVGGKLSFH